MFGLRFDDAVKRPSLLLAPEAAELILELSRLEYPRETGGALAGFKSANGVVITHATGPGPRAERGRATFRRDGDSTQGSMDQILGETGGVSDYVGEWHSHPSPVGPSTMDRSAMSRISGNPAYRTPEPILLIAQRTRWRRWRLLGFRWSECDLEPVRVSVSRHPPDR
jgi:integrative and conjugative element protein (TIGR02256 family)